MTTERTKNGAASGFMIVHDFMFGLGLNSSELLVYAVLFSFTKNKGLFFGSQEYISKRLGLSRSTVKRALRGLEERGLVRTRSRKSTQVLEYRASEPRWDELVADTDTLCEEEYVDPPIENTDGGKGSTSSFAVPEEKHPSPDEIARRIREKHCTDDEDEEDYEELKRIAHEEAVRLLGIKRGGDGKDEDEIDPIERMVKKPSDPPPGSERATPEVRTSLDNKDSTNKKNTPPTTTKGLRAKRAFEKIEERRSGKEWDKYVDIRDVPLSKMASIETIRYGDSKVVFVSERQNFALLQLVGHKRDILNEYIRRLENLILCGRMDISVHSHYYTLRKWITEDLNRY